MKNYFILSEVCAIPTFINGHIEPHERGHYKANETAQILCDPGYVPDNPLTTCTLSRLWNPEPACTLIICNSLPPAIQHGRYLTWGRSLPFTYNQAISPVCDEGYHLHTPGERACVFTDTWSGSDPTCLSKSGTAGYT